MRAISLELKVLLDTNVVLDVFLLRSPWMTESERILRAIEDGKASGYMTASSVTDIFYLMRQSVGAEKARASIKMCLDLLEVCAVTREILVSASELAGHDFEDDVQICCAIEDGLDAIVTRDAKGFLKSPIAILTPAEFLSQL
jgi:predicted nucleic acid-binding protein